ncbi:26S proteasome regulatory subunit N8 [Nematocida sp. AWRm80]|nr:26S proteasome regulatory subunit N8 [Nematocida sp. AWRm80]
MHAFKKVIVHPLVLLSVADHYKRMDQPRVVGTLLGRIEGDVAHITSTYAVPFDEHESNSDVWFFDTSYNENMYKLFYKVNSTEVILGWYHTGVYLYKNDLQITQTFQTYTKDPILAVIDVEHAKEGSPVKCYRLERESKTVADVNKFVFSHIPFEIEAEEAEEVGVEQLIEGIRDMHIGDIGHKISLTINALTDLHKGLNTIEEYLLDIEENRKEYNTECINLIQELMNSIPRRIPAKMSEYTEKMEMSSFISASIRSIVLLNEIKK